LKVPYQPGSCRDNVLRLSAGGFEFEYRIGCRLCCGFSRFLTVSQGCVTASLRPLPTHYSWISFIVIWPCSPYAFLALSLRYNVRNIISTAHWHDLIKMRTTLAVGALFTLEKDISVGPKWHTTSQCCVFRGFEMYHPGTNLYLPLLRNST